MTNSNFPPDNAQSLEPRKSFKNIIIGVLAVALVSAGVFFIANKNKTSATIQHQQIEIATVADEKSEIQKGFDASLARLDSFSTLNSNLQGKLSERNIEITKTKAEIRKILNNKNATAAQLTKAKNLIAGLNEKITGMEEQVAQLTQDNQILIQDKVVLTLEKEKLNQELTTTTVAKDSLVQKVDVASTLNASNISITPVDIKQNGKEKITATAKRVNKLVISFDVNNRIAAAGTSDVFVCVIGPDGKHIAAPALNSGTFTTREDGEKEFTAKLPVDIETAKKKNVEFSFSTGSNFQQGNYTILIYQNGFLIGEGTRQLKKGGLFS